MITYVIKNHYIYSAITRGSYTVDRIVERDGVSDRKLWNKIVISHVPSRSFSTASETMPVFEGKLQAFERPYFHDERAAIHTLLRGTSRSLHMRAKLVSLFRSLPPRLMYLCISTDWLLLDSHSRIHAGGNYVENTRKSAIFASRNKEK